MRELKMLRVANTKSTINNYAIWSLMGNTSTQNISRE